MYMYVTTVVSYLSSMTMYALKMFHKFNVYKITAVRDNSVYYMKCKPLVHMHIMYTVDYTHMRLLCKHMHM